MKKSILFSFLWTCIGSFIQCTPLSSIPDSLNGESNKNKTTKKVNAPTLTENNIHSTNWQLSSKIYHRKKGGGNLIVGLVAGIGFSIGIASLGIVILPKIGNINFITYRSEYDEIAQSDSSIHLRQHYPNPQPRERGIPQERQNNNNRFQFPIAITTFSDISSDRSIEENLPIPYCTQLINDLIKMSYDEVKASRKIYVESFFTEKKDTEGKVLYAYFKTEKERARKKNKEEQKANEGGEEDKEQTHVNFNDKDALNECCVCYDHVPTYLFCRCCALLCSTCFQKPILKQCPACAIPFPKDKKDRAKMLYCYDTVLREKKIIKKKCSSFYFNERKMWIAGENLIWFDDAVFTDYPKNNTEKKCRTSSCQSEEAYKFLLCGCTTQPRCIACLEKLYNTSSETYVKCYECKQNIHKDKIAIAKKYLESSEDKRPSITLTDIKSIEEWMQKRNQPKPKRQYYV